MVGNAGMSGTRALSHVGHWVEAHLDSGTQLVEEVLVEIKTKLVDPQRLGLVRSVKGRRALLGLK